MNKCWIAVKKCHDSEDNLLPNQWYWQIMFWAEGKNKNDGTYHRSGEVGGIN